MRFLLIGLAFLASPVIAHEPKLDLPLQIVFGDDFAGADFDQAKWELAAPQNCLVANRCDASANRPPKDRVPAQSERDRRRTAIGFAILLVGLTFPIAVLSPIKKVL